jgi:transcriptional regulator GlxA family with amidase domain
MKRRDLLATAAAAVATMTATATASASPAAASAPLQRLNPPHGRPIGVAFVVGELANLIDVAGPAEVFQDTWAGATLDQTIADTHGPFLNRPNMPFSVYLVSDTAAPSQVGPHLRMLPTYTLADATEPDIVIVGAQSSPSPAKIAWLQRQAKRTDLMISICTGAFVLAQAGLLDGKSATTHHSFYDIFAQQYPKVTLVRGVRYVDDGRIATAGGLTSGIDLALHVVARYFGEPAADATANWMEFTRMTTRPSTTLQG